MPNYVRNSLMFSGKSNEILEFLSGENGPVDFNKIAEIPEQLNIDDTSEGRDAATLLAIIGLSRCGERIDLIEKLNLLDKESVDLGRQYLRNISDTGYATWYGWQIANWGVKWNAISGNVLDDCVIFDTPWSDVTGLMEKLSLKFPDVCFLYKYADDNIGYNCGYGEIENGVSRMTELDGGTSKAYVLSFELWPEYRKYYEYDSEKDVFTHKED